MFSQVKNLQGALALRYFSFTLTQTLPEEFDSFQLQLSHKEKLRSILTLTKWERLKLTPLVRQTKREVF